MADLFNVFNITPHSFDKEFNPNTDQRSFYRSVRGRILPCEKKHHPYSYTPLYGAFCYGLTDEKYKQLGLNYCNEYLSFIKKLIDKDRMIFSHHDNLKTENEFISNKEFPVDGTICSESIFKNTEDADSRKITSSWHLSEEQSPKWWGHNEDHRIPITYNDLIPYLKNFLKFAPIIQIWDTHILKEQYDKFHLFMNDIGSANKKAEVEINVQRNKISAQGELHDHQIKPEVYDKFRDWFKEPKFDLRGISKVTVLIWDDAHDRYIVSSKLGGFHLGKGPQEEEPPKKGKRKKIKTQSVTQMSPIQVEQLEDDYDEEGFGNRKFYEKSIVYP